MAFRVSLSQMEQARAVAERALDTIEMTRELERVNVWIAYINLEVKFGTAGKENDLQKASAVWRVFDRATKRVTDVLDLHLQVFASLRDTSPVIAGEVMNRALRSFKSSKEVWIAAGTAKMIDGEPVEARKLLQRALLSLEKRDHVAIVVKFAQLEYTYGSVERARTAFESLIGNYPKRLDIWNVFLDKESGVCRSIEDTKSEERMEAIDRTRTLFERCSQLELSIKKMKSVFKKWVDFENKFGGKESRKDVLDRARVYVQRKDAENTGVHAGGND